MSINRDEHLVYIHQDLANIMRKVVSSANLLGNGMDFFAVNGYLLQSLFLQMTGAQEQKMKCICWELATDDLEYRYKRYYNKGWSLHQCSTLTDKNHVYEDLVEAIILRDSDFSLFDNDDAKRKFRDEILEQMTKIFKNTNIALCHKQEYESFKDIFGRLDEKNIVTNKKDIFKMGNKENPVSCASSDTEIFAIYSLLYRHRNRCAHNTLSYQLNFPTFHEFRSEKHRKFDNIFLFYAVLLMIDGIFRRLFSTYESLREVEPMS